MIETDFTGFTEAFTENFIESVSFDFLWKGE